MSVKRVEPAVFRLIVELGEKSNDDCWVTYAGREYSYAEESPDVSIRSRAGVRISPGGRVIVKSRLALCRPVYELEVRQGLVTSGPASPLYDCGVPGTPDCTLWLDAVHTFARLMGHQVGMEQLWGKSRTMSEIVGAVIDAQYSPAVSAGMPVHLMSILKYVVEHLPDVDMSVSCNNIQQMFASAPRLTLAEFYEEVRGAPDLREADGLVAGVADRLLLEAGNP